MTGYTRQATFSNSDVADANQVNDEFNQLVAAFSTSAGHTHDGTAAQGGKIPLISNTTGGASITTTNTDNIVIVGTVNGRDLDNDSTKLDTIEPGATADQTGSEIKSLYEAEPDTNSLTDDLLSKINSVESNSTADQTGSEIKSLYEAEPDTNAFSDILLTKLNNIEDSATSDQTGSEIKSLYEAEPDTNPFDDASVTKLAGIEYGATSDQTATEILNLLKTVDGLGSGLDSDTISGTSISEIMKQSSSTGAGIIPSGLTSERPSTPSEGMIRYNTSVNTFESYGVSGWEPLGESLAIATKEEAEEGTNNESVMSPLRVYQSILANTSEQVPTGMPIPWPLSTAPNGYLLMVGQAFDKNLYPKLGLAYPSGFLLDMRGQFIRGWDNGRGVDSGRSINTLQGYSTRYSFTNYVNTVVASPGVSYSYTSKSIPVSGTSGYIQTGTNSSGSDVGIRIGNTYTGSETRPNNIALNYIVRAN